MSKILIFHQPFPMGNYKLNEVLANKLKVDHHEVYTLEQLNGAPPNVIYIQQLKDLDPDIVYFEMLDEQTFVTVHKCFPKALKILCYTSPGILKTPENLIPYYKKWFDKIITNSKECYSYFTNNKITTEYFPYYFSVIPDKPKEQVFKKEYNHDSVFLGMGFGRLTESSYGLERSVFFQPTTEIDFGIYGNGWGNHPNYKGILPPDDIGNLYNSAKSAMAIIGKSQRKLGMINNRYTEIFMSMCPLISYPYPEINWYGMAPNINFVRNKAEFIDNVKYIKSKYENDFESHMENLINIKNKFSAFNNIFFEKLNVLIN